MGAITSMTGFARRDGGLGGLNWTWEVRSVNARGLDVRVRLQGGYERLEPQVRGAVARHARRGAVGLVLSVVRPGAQGVWRVNESLLRELAGLVRRLGPETGLNPGRLADLLAVRGVMEQVDGIDSDDTREARDAALLADLDAALADLDAVRRREGSALRPALNAHLDEIGALAATAAGAAATRPDALRARLKAQLAAIMDAVPAPDPDRVAQEAALLIAKGDVREELDRLAAHVAAARALLDGGGPVGRKLDFLCQEFNRETNTICAKAGDLGLTRTGLDLKVAVDRLREQVQNIE